PLPTPETNSSGPQRYIYTQTDMEHFKHSSARKELLSFVSAMGKGLTSKENTPLQHLSPALASLHGSLTCMSTTWMDGNHSDGLPPDRKVKARFGNPVFRTWHERLVNRSYGIVNCLMDCREEEIIAELRAYLHDSFGHPIRIDYGTGHESSFIVFLLSLCKIGCFSPSPQSISLASLSLFHAYLNVTRGLQRDYMLEPAGSHGVWGLDDYHCVPFYLGACQMMAREHTTPMPLDTHNDILEHWNPSIIHTKQTLEAHRQTYLYFSCIHFIQKIKPNVPFFESSPMLNDISSIGSWSKVASGLLRLYEGEVLDKMPVVQHFVFG
ncbi:phosphotyrosyl phosphatase, partial [Thalassiosira pseudonana CCMP1335]